MQGWWISIQLLLLFAWNYDECDKNDSHDPVLKVSMSVNNNYSHSKLTAKIIGAAMEVHTTLGTGFQEVIYQRALAFELQDRKINYIREQEMEILYKNRSVGTRRVDFFVEETVMVEIKALTQLENVHLAQAINYLEAYDLEVGLLINFGANRLEFKRVSNKKYMPS